MVGLDQLTKHLVRTGIDPGETHKFLPGIQLVHVRNTGVAFSLFSGGGTVVLVFTLVALAVLLGYFTMRPSRPWLWLPTGLLIGGALGNLIDRIAHGAVTDFVEAAAVAGVQRRRHGDHARGDHAAARARGPARRWAVASTCSRFGCPTTPLGLAWTGSWPSRWARAPRLRA